MGVDNNTFVCAACGETFEKGWSEEEALAELEETFGDVSVEDCEVLCDECYKKVVTW